MKAYRKRIEFRDLRFIVECVLFFVPRFGMNTGKVSPGCNLSAKRLDVLLYGSNPFTIVETA